MKVMLPILLLFGCLGLTENEEEKMVTKDDIECTDQECFGTYLGPEFIDGSDVAHQFSNTMSHVVGDKLKQLYTDKKYSKVDFSKIAMSTEGMGSGVVTYTLVIPFMEVQTKCEAFTSFDHVGGWNHKPNLSKRIIELSDAILPNETLDISTLKTTEEGLQEYWIQWKNKNTQADCI